LRFAVMSENQSFDFLKIVSHGSLIPKPYLSVLSLKKREDKTLFCFGKCCFSKWQKLRILKVFSHQI